MALDILNKFTTNLKNTLVRAINLAIRLKHPFVLPLHLLISLSEQTGSVAHELLEKNAITPEQLHIVLNKLAESNNQASYALPQLADDTVRVLEHAAVVAFEHQHKFIGTEHLLLSLVELPDELLEQTYHDQHVDTAQLRQQVINLLNSTSRFPDMAALFKEELAEVKQSQPGEPTEEPTSKTPALDFFGTNLTEPNVQNKIDPVVGRDDEIERLVHILSRRTKNNPVLLGEPGVGKTAIVEGLAKRIVNRSVPIVLQDKTIFRLDLGLVVAGTMFRGEFEARFKQILEELADNPDIILFIDEIHTVVGAGSGGGTMDAANILKPGLARGEIRCIGATTLKEYHRYIEADSALERRFQPIIVEEPSMEDAIKVLQGIKDSYETYHHVRISNEAITAAVKLSVRYIQDKWLPDKAIDLIDEGAARLRIRRPANPLDEAYRDLTEKIKAVQQDKKTEADLRSQLAQLEKRITKEDQLVLGTVSAEDIATVVARITKIPIQNLLAPEKKNLLNLANILNEHVVGQTEATTAVAEFIRRSGAGLTQADRPIGSFLFLGPSGVGKTELAKTLAATVFGDEKSLIRLDMSEFSEPFTASKLIGAPAGYVGYKEGSKLIDQVRHRPYSLILFDEIEKAHRDIFNVLLQILDEGHLTDATGKQVNFKNTIIIMTSNIGLREFQDHAALGFNSAHTTTITPGYDVVKDKVLQELNRQFRPEFLNRIDKTIVFKPLDLTAIQQIVELQLKELSDRAKEKSLTLTYTKQLVKHIAAIGYTPQQGARAIRRTIQEHIENRLAEYMLADKAKAGNTVAIGFRNGAINLTVK